MKPSERVDQMLAELTDWRGKTLAAVRKCVLDADPEIVEDWKYLGSPVWSRDGTIAVGNAHKGKVKVTFAHGAQIKDPDRLFNNGLGGKEWRAIDFSEGDNINRPALTKLVRAAIAYNLDTKKKRLAATAAKSPGRKKRR